MSNFLIRSGTFQLSSYPIVLTRLGVPRSTFKIMEESGLIPEASWLVVLRQAAVFLLLLLLLLLLLFLCGFIITDKRVSCAWLGGNVVV